MSYCVLPDAKRQKWAKELVSIIHRGWLEPDQASQFCGRLSFLNQRIFNSVGRALLRPLIWRQHQRFWPVHADDKVAIRVDVVFGFVATRLLPRDAFDYARQ